MRFEYENRGPVTFYVCTLDEGERVDELGLGMLTNNRIGGCLRPVFSQEDDTPTLRFNVSSRVPLANLMGGGMSKERVLNVLGGLAETFGVLDSYMLETRKIILDRERIFCDVSSGKPELIYLPVEGFSEEKSFDAFAREVFRAIKYEVSEEAAYAASLMNFFNETKEVSPEGLKDAVKAAGNAFAGAPAQGGYGGKANGPAAGMAPQFYGNAAAQGGMPFGGAAGAAPSAGAFGAARAPAAAGQAQPSAVLAGAPFGAQNYMAAAGRPMPGNGTGAAGTAGMQGIPAAKTGAAAGGAGELGDLAGLSEEGGRKKKKGLFGKRGGDEKPKKKGLFGKRNKDKAASSLDEALSGGTAGQPGNAGNSGGVFGAPKGAAANPAGFNGGAGGMNAGNNRAGYQSPAGGSAPGYAQANAAYRQAGAGFAAGTAAANGSANAAYRQANASQINAGGSTGFQNMGAGFAAGGSGYQANADSAASPSGTGYQGQGAGFAAGTAAANGSANTAYRQANAGGAAAPSSAGYQGQGAGFATGSGFSSASSMGAANASYGQAAPRADEAAGAWNGGAAAVQAASEARGQGALAQSFSGNDDGDRTVMIGMERRQFGGQGGRAVIRRVKTGAEAEVTKDVFRIGKQRNYVDFYVDGNAFISRSHADIIKRDGEYFIRDNNSLNNTRLNGEVIPSSTEVRLRSGDTIVMGDEEFEFKVK